MAAMSGGVDSAVAASLLLEQGYEVWGATLLLRSDSGAAADNSDESPKTCGSLADIEDAKAVAARLGIPHDVFDFTGLFRETVVEKFGRVYAAGGTPNPCIDCNRHLKFGARSNGQRPSAWTRSRPAITRGWRRIPKPGGCCSKKPWMPPRIRVTSSTP